MLESSSCCQAVSLYLTVPIPLEQELSQLYQQMEYKGDG